MKQLIKTLAACMLCATLSMTAQAQQPETDAVTSAAHHDAERIELQQDIIERQNDSLQQMKLEQKKVESGVKQREMDIMKKKHLYSNIAAIVFIILLVITIIVSRSRIQRMRKLNNDLQEAHREVELALNVKQQFLKNISHEMRTPLNAIAGFANVLATSGDDMPRQERDRLYSIINENTNRLTHIIDNIIELSNYETCNSLPMSDVIDPGYLCTTVAKEMQPNVNQGVRLIATANLPENYTVRTNQQALRKMLSHLTENAVRYTDRGRVELYVHLSGSMLQFTVTDTGLGISEAHKKLLFQPYSEAEGDAHVMGVGLSICRCIARLLGGDIRYDNNYIHGTRFIVEIPDE